MTKKTTFYDKVIRRDNSSKIWHRQESIVEKMVMGRLHCKYTG